MIDPINISYIQDDNDNDKFTEKCENRIYELLLYNNKELLNYIFNIKNKDYIHYIL